MLSARSFTINEELKLLVIWDFLSFNLELSTQNTRNSIPHAPALGIAADILWALPKDMSGKPDPKGNALIINPKPMQKPPIV